MNSKPEVKLHELKKKKVQRNCSTPAPPPPPPQTPVTESGIMGCSCCISLVSSIAKTFLFTDTPIQPKPEVAWKRSLRALVSKKMASAQASRKISHKCCAAALCNNRSENRPDLIYFSFPSDENLRRIWNQKMKRGDTKFASNTSLFCCSEHFRKDIDYKILDLW